MYEQNSRLLKNVSECLHELPVEHSWSLTDSEWFTVIVTLIERIKPRCEERLEISRIKKINKTFLYHLSKEFTLIISTDVLYSILNLFEYVTNTKLGSWVY